MLNLNHTGHTLLIMDRETFELLSKTVHRSLVAQAAHEVRLNAEP